MKKLVIFDCDGTLVDSEIIACKIFPAIWSAMGVEISEDFFLCNFVGVADESVVVKETLARLPSNAMEVASQQFHKELKTKIQPVKGMIELLEKLNQPVCVASNSSISYLHEVLSITSLAKFFGDRIYSARQLQRPKPAPDIFLHAANSLGFSKQQCIVIEDSVSGIKAAQNAGMTVIGFMGGLHCNQAVRDRLQSAHADFYCSDTLELQKLILDEV